MIYFNHISAGEEGAKMPHHPNYKKHLQNYSLDVKFSVAIFYLFLYIFHLYFYLFFPKADIKNKQLFTNFVGKVITLCDNTVSDNNSLNYKVLHFLHPIWSLWV